MFISPLAPATRPRNRTDDQGTHYTQRRWKKVTETAQSMFQIFCAPTKMVHKKKQMSHCLLPHF